MLGEVVEAGEIEVSMIARRFPRFYDFALVVTGVAERSDFNNENESLPTSKQQLKHSSPS